MNHYEVIKRPLVTEKCARLQAEGNQYVFEVDRRATKRDIRDAVAKVFNVTVTGVWTTTVPGKYKRVGRNVGRTNAWKKAIVALKEGDRIGVFEGA